MIQGKKPTGTIAIMGGVPAIQTEFVWSFTQMIQYNSEYLCEPNQSILYLKASISFHAAARNSLVDQMKGDWLLMLDTDHQFDPDIAARMVHKMNKYNLPVLTGIYQHKSPPHSPVLYNWNKDQTSFEAMGDWDRPEGEYFIPVASAGAGCLMVRRWVFDKIREELNESPFDIIHPFGEDHSFFMRLKKIGVQAYCDPSIECYHLGVRPIRLTDYQKEKVVISKEKST